MGGNHQPDIFDLQELVRILLRYNWDNNWNMPGNYSHMATHTWLAGKFSIYSSLIFPAIQTSMASLGIVQPPLMTPEGQGYREPRNPMPKRVCLKIGYIPNYSHLIGIMIINHWV